jgi:hypothetical protein
MYVTFQRNVSTRRLLTQRRRPTVEADSSEAGVPTSQAIGGKRTCEQVHGTPRFAKSLLPEQLTARATAFAVLSSSDTDRTWRRDHDCEAIEVFWLCSAD